jgi:hypothetical protein
VTTYQLTRAFATLIKVLMRFKRNQVEAAIGRQFEPGSAKPSSELRTRTKRLLDVDRGLGRNKRSADPARANYAFYSEDGPGRGVEMWFSGYEAFALATALRLMLHGWPQGFAVAILRHVRPELEKEYDRIMRQDPAILFDEEQIRRNARPGDPAVDNTDPVFLLILSQGAQDRSGSVKAAICRGHDKCVQFVRSELGQAWTTFELVNSAHALFRELARTKPSKRGRGRK